MKLKLDVIALSIVVLAILIILVGIIPRETVTTGTSSFISFGNSFDFSSGLILNDSIDGDIVYSGNPNPPPYGNRTMVSGGTRYYLHPTNAQGLYDAMRDINIDCRQVNYSRRTLDLGDSLLHNRTICVKTEEGWTAKIVFYSKPTSISNRFGWVLNWTIIKGQPLFFSTSATAMQISEPINTRSKIDPYVLERLSIHEHVPVIISMKPNGGNVFTIDRVLNSFGHQDFGLRFISRNQDVFSGDITLQGLQKLIQDDDVGYVFYNYPVRGVLNNRSLEYTNVTPVWNKQYLNENITGQNQVICIVDSGINYSHQDLGGCNPTSDINDGSCAKVIGGYDLVNNDSNPMDDCGHGTHIAGIVAANGSIKGAAPYSKLVGVKVLDANNGGYADNFAEGIKWCTNHKTQYNISIIVISASLTYENNSDMLSSSFCDGNPVVDAANNATQQGIFVVASSGNDGATFAVGYPACGSNVTAAGSVYDNDYGPRELSFHDEGAGSCWDFFTGPDTITCHTNVDPEMLDVLAPGYMINSTVPNGDCMYCAGSGYAEETGTSASSPHVGGSVALLLQYEKLRNVTLTPLEIEQRLKDTGKLVWDANSQTNYSRIDVYAALFPIDVFDLLRLKASSNHNIFGFKIQNNYNNQTKNVSWSFDIGNGTTINNDYNITLLPKKSVFVYFEYNYSDGDVYSINATASSGEDSDSETMTISLGDIITYDMKLLGSSSRERIFGFKILNNMNATKGVNWTLNTGQGAISANNLTYLNSSKTVFVYVAYNYTAPGTFTVNATAMNGSISDSTRNIVIDV